MLNEKVRQAALESMAESKGEKPRPQPANAVQETNPSESAGFFAGEAADGPKADSNGQNANPAVPKGGPRRRVNFRGQIVPCADGSLRNISECWQDLFKMNEELMLDDSDLSQRMADLFPGREESKQFHMIQRIRSQYNSGRLPGMSSIPEKQSRRFRRVGDCLYEINARGHVLKVMYETGAVRVERRKQLGVNMRSLRARFADRLTKGL